jgi:hypothetical protein
MILGAAGPEREEDPSAAPPRLLRTTGLRISGSRCHPAARDAAADVVRRRGGGALEIRDSPRVAPAGQAADSGPTAGSSSINSTARRITIGSMKVFLSWSGDKSRAVALALREWLPLVINALEPFVSAQDIAAGTHWQTEVAGQLEASDFGIVCVTADNQEATWLNFESGALAKAVGSARVVPLAIDLKVTDVKLPLAQFQAQPGTRTGILAVLTSLNSSCERSLSEDRLTRAFDHWWGELEPELSRIARRPASGASASPERSERDLLEEILATVRSNVGPESATLHNQILPVDLVIGELVEHLPPGAPALRFTIVDVDDAAYFVVRSDERLPPTQRSAIARLAKRRGYDVKFVQSPTAAE